MLQPLKGHIQATLSYKKSILGQNYVLIYFFVKQSDLKMTKTGNV